MTAETAAQCSTALLFLATAYAAKAQFPLLRFVADLLHKFDKMAAWLRNG